MLQKFGSWLALFSELFPSHAFKVENTNGTKLGVPTCKLNRIGYPGSRSAITVKALGQVIKNTVKLCIFYPCSAGPFVLRNELVVLQVSLQSIPSFFSHIALMTSSQSRHCLPKPKRASPTLWQAWWMCLVDTTTKKPGSPAWWISLFGG